MTMPRTILAATDFSSGADCAVRYAFELAQQLGARVHLLHAYTVPALPDAVALGADAAGLIMAGAEQAIAREAERYRQLPEFGGAAHQLGDPRDVIAQRARQLPADLIVIGSHGRRGKVRPRRNRRGWINKTPR